VQVAEQRILPGFVLLLFLLQASVTTRIAPVAPVGAEPGPVHDVAVADVKPVLPYGALEVYPGWLVNVSVAVRNEGDSPETFNVTVYYDPRFYLDEDNVIGTQNVVDLPPGENRTLTFTWKAPGIIGRPPIMGSGDPPAMPANYTISAEASVVPGEVDTGDNAYTDGNVTVRICGDASGDGRVSGTDLAILGRAWYGVYPDHRYDWRADWSGDGKLTGSDLAIMGRWWYYHV